MSAGLLNKGKQMTVSHEENSMIEQNANRRDWVKPVLNVVVAIDETEGLGGGGPDFGSELS